MLPLRYLQCHGSRTGRDLNHTSPGTHQLAGAVEGRLAAHHHRRSPRSPWRRYNRYTGHGSQNSQRCRCGCRHLGIGHGTAHTERQDILHRNIVHNGSHRHGTCHNPVFRRHHQRRWRHSEAAGTHGPHTHGICHIYPSSVSPSASRIVFRSMPASRPETISSMTAAYSTIRHAHSQTVLGFHSSSTSAVSVSLS